MGYTPTDMMFDCLAECSVTYDIQSKEWSWDEDYEEALGSLLENDELKFDPAAKSAEIEAAKPDNYCVTVLYTGEWFEEIWEAFLYIEEKKSYAKLLERAYRLGFERELNFDNAFAKLTGGGKIND